jgi:hypothetical protein
MLRETAMVLEGKEPTDRSANALPIKEAFLSVPDKFFKCKWFEG